MNRRYAHLHLTPGQVFTLCVTVWLLYSTYTTLRHVGAWPF
jgi:hypothetical protein